MKTLRVMTVAAFVAGMVALTLAGAAIPAQAQTPPQFTLFLAAVAPAPGRKIRMARP
ncbi:MAG TPA: hypothetical protein VMR62_04200 [Bryobacteraceae bacterium]|jgi:hypothetical protein|nr:hypothetical protein [Bryobacteraceae bacterium]